MSLDLFWDKLEKALSEASLLLRDIATPDEISSARNKRRDLRKAVILGIINDLRNECRLQPNIVRGMLAKARRDMESVGLTADDLGLTPDEKTRWHF